MVDTLGFTLQLSVVGNYIDFINEVGAKIKVDIKKSNEFKVIGTLKNLRVYIEREFIRIEGSLPKYYYGTNLKPLSYSEIGLIIDELSEKLGIPLRDADIFRIDMAENIEVKNSPQSYFSFLGDLARFDRIMRKGTLYYEQGWCKLCFYDKIVEASKHNDLYLTEELLSKNILRYEVRYMRDWLKKYFGRNIKVWEICNGTVDVYCELIAKWFLIYENIVKIGQLDFDFEMTMKGLGKWAILNMYRNGIDILKLIENHSKKEGKSAGYLKREVCKLVTEAYSVNESIEELNIMLFKKVCKYID